MENFLIHCTEPKDGPDAPGSEQVWRWGKDKEIHRSTWHTEPVSDQFPEFGEARIEEGGITACELIGGRSGVKFKLVNDIVFKDGTPAFKSVWVFCYRDESRGQKNLYKVFHPMPSERPAKVEKIPWVAPGKAVTHV